MGIWKNLRAGAAFMREYQQAAMETLLRRRARYEQRQQQHDVDPRRDAVTAVRELADAARVPPGRAAGGGLACGRAAGFA